MVAVNVYFRLNVIGRDTFLISHLPASSSWLYALLIFYYHRIWDRIPVTDSPPEGCRNPVVPAIQPVYLVIIPARNEALHIGNCLEDLLIQILSGCKSTEIIVVNDFSTDDTAARVSAYPRQMYPAESFRLCNRTISILLKRKPLRPASAILPVN